jgi:alkyl hydroperoxide reductase subunit AhpC
MSAPADPVLSKAGADLLKKQNYIRIGDTAPNFTADTSQGEIEFHKYIEGKWALLMSHPKDFTPVCTTEIGTVALLKDEWKKRNVVPLVVSVDDAKEHKEWIKEINKVKNTSVEFPIIDDKSKKLSLLYGMLDQDHLSDAGLPLTVRSVFIINPEKKVKLILTYPAATGRSFPEILRVIDSLQRTAYHKCATPANWQVGENVVIVPSLTDAQAKEHFGEFTVVSASCKIREAKDPVAKKA